ncbi:MAG: GDP-mannose 4,6-dehydratase [candidate division Zixibacteria bacterium]
MKALITGITGQDGSYLAEFLLSRGYKVHGIIRPASSSHTGRINHIIDRLQLHQVDILDQMEILHLLEEIKPNEIYNLVGMSCDLGKAHQFEMGGQTNAIGPVKLLEAIRMIDPQIKFFQASTSEIFAPSDELITENSPFDPTSAYAISKFCAHQMTVMYREKYNLITSCGILFDHESPRRNPRYLTRQITRGAAKIKLGLQDRLVLDTIDIQKDWGYAGDYVRAFWMMIQHPRPDNFIIATGKLRSLEDFCQTAFAAVDLDWQDYLTVRDSLILRVNPKQRIGDASHAHRKLLWEPEVSFNQIVQLMVDSELERLSPKYQIPTEFLSNSNSEVPT